MLVKRVMQHKKEGRWLRTGQRINVYRFPDSRVHGANMGPTGSCRPQMGTVLAPWTLLSGLQGVALEGYAWWCTWATPRFYVCHGTMQTSVGSICHCFILWRGKILNLLWVGRRSGVGGHLHLTRRLCQPSGWCGGLDTIGILKTCRVVGRLLAPSDLSTKCVSVRQSHVL